MVSLGHKVRIRLDAVGRGVVHVDGVQVSCRHLTVDAPARERPTVTLTLICAELDVEATAQVLLAGELRPSTSHRPPDAEGG